MCSSQELRPRYGILNVEVRTQLLMRVAEGHGDLGQMNGGDCHRVKWCPCLLADGDGDDDNMSSDDVNKLLVVIRGKNVSACLLSFAPHDHQNLTSLAFFLGY